MAVASQMDGAILPFLVARAWLGILIILGNIAVMMECVEAVVRVVEEAPVEVEAPVEGVEEAPVEVEAPVEGVEETSVTKIHKAVKRTVAIGEDAATTKFAVVKDVWLFVMTVEEIREVIATATGQMMGPAQTTRVIFTAMGTASLLLTATPDSKNATTGIGFALTHAPAELPEETAAQEAGVEAEEQPRLPQQPQRPPFLMMLSISPTGSCMTGKTAISRLWRFCAA